MKNIMKNKIVKSILLILGFMIIGFGSGFILGEYFGKSIDMNVTGINIFDTIIKISAFLLIVLGGFLVHIIIHEAGHMIFGLMTDYSYVSFRIGSHTIVRQDGKLKLKKFNIPGTAGQCLMVPPELKNGKYPFVIYNFGGAIMNLIVAIVSILVIVYVDNLPFYINIILATSGICGIFLGLTNAIPLKIGGIANDGYNVLSMYRDEDARMGFYLQLKINGLQSQGMRLKDMPFEDFKLEDGADFSNPLNTGLGLMRYYWYLDNMDFEMAKKCIESMIPYLNSMVVLFSFEINCERIFLELIGDCDKSFIDNLYDKNLKKYIKAAKYMIGKKRVVMAYEGLYNKDNELALDQYKDIKELASRYAIKGEADMELMISDWVIEKMQRETVN